MADTSATAVAPSTPAYVANPDSGLFHLPTCSVCKKEPCPVALDSVLQATMGGYRGCDVCKPDVAFLVATLGPVPKAAPMKDDDSPPECRKDSDCALLPSSYSCPSCGECSYSWKMAGTKEDLRQRAIEKLAPCQADWICRYEGCSDLALLGYDLELGTAAGCKRGHCVAIRPGVPRLGSTGHVFRAMDQNLGIHWSLTDRDGKAEEPATSKMSSWLHTVRRRIVSCYSKALAKSPGAAGQVKVSLTFGSDGKPGPATVLLDTTGSPGLADCIGVAAGRVHMRKDEGTTLKWDILLRPLPSGSGFPVWDKDSH